MNKIELSEYLASQNRPQVKDKPGMARQIWEDGELTLQKSGDLLWLRTLHCIEPAFCKPVPIDCFPEENREKEHAYLWIESKAQGEAIQQKLAEYRE